MIVCGFMYEFGDRLTGTPYTGVYYECFYAGFGEPMQPELACLWLVTKIRYPLILPAQDVEHR